MMIMRMIKMMMISFDMIYDNHQQRILHFFFFGFVFFVVVIYKENN